MKKVPIYFYYLEVKRLKLRENSKIFTLKDFEEHFSDMLLKLKTDELIDKKYDFSKDEKVIWLDSYERMSSGNYNLVFKSAKYNHVRTVIDTNIMEEKGTIKSSSDGDEEKTHLCIRYNTGKDCFICIHENNYYGMAVNRIICYLNDKLRNYREYINGDFDYILSTEIMPCDNFLEELRKMEHILLLKVTIDRQNLQDGFLRLAGRDDVKDTIEICVGKIKRNKYIPKNLVSEYYDDMQKENVIKRIVAEGKNATGSFRLDTELIKMKQFLLVKTTNITKEVDSIDYFDKAQILINGLRKSSEEDSDEDSYAFTHK